MAHGSLGHSQLFITAPPRPSQRGQPLRGLSVSTGHSSLSLEPLAPKSAMSNQLASHGVDTMWLLHSAHNAKVVSQKKLNFSGKMGMLMKITPSPETQNHRGHKKRSSKIRLFFWHRKGPILHDTLHCAIRQLQPSVLACVPELVWAAHRVPSFLPLASGRKAGRGSVAS